MRITDALLGEHGAFTAQFDLLEQELPHATSAAGVRDQAALLAAALLSHAKLEDELLFERMVAVGGNAGLVSALDEEHSQIADRLARAQGTHDVARARTELLRAVSLARHHFAREERMVFPMAEALLGADALTALAALWAERRGVAVEAT